MSEYCYPQGLVLYRNLHKSFPVIRSGRGAYLYDSSGKKYLDGSGGAAVVNIGHGVKEVAAALSRQAGKAAYLSGVQFTHEPVEKLAARVSSFLPFPDAKVFFLTSGSEAIEASIKLARQYWVESGFSIYPALGNVPKVFRNRLSNTMTQKRLEVPWREAGIMRRYRNDTFSSKVNSSFRLFFLLPLDRNSLHFSAFERN